MFYDKIRNIRLHKLLSLIIVFYILICAPLATAQTTITYGENRLLEKYYSYEKYTSTITPVITIKDQYSSYFNIVFEINWRDKNEQSIYGFDNTFIYLVDKNNNLWNYCAREGKKLKDGRKSGDKRNFPPSFNITPKQNFTIDPLDDGIVIQNSQPIRFNIVNYTSDLNELELSIYIGKKKKNDLIIIEKSNTLKWEFILPVKKSMEGLTCEEMHREYKKNYENNIPPKPFRWYENRFDLYQSIDGSLQDYKELAKSVNNYRSGLQTAKIIIQYINQNKDTLFCEKLIELRQEIKDYLKTEQLVDDLFNSIYDVITNIDETTTFVKAVTIKDFKKNHGKIKRYYEALWDSENKKENTTRSDQSIIVAYKDSIDALRLEQDTLVKRVGEINSQSLMAFYKRNFDIFSKDIDELIDKPDTEIPAVMTEIAVPLANDSKKAAEKRKFSIFWIIVPVLLIIILLLGFKKFIAFFKKVGMLKSKLIGKVRK